MVESAGSVESCSCEKWEAGIWGRGQFGNPEEGERQPWEAATKQRSEDRDNLCVIVIWSVKSRHELCVKVAGKSDYQSKRRL
jgi:hypothetical protein